NAVDGIPLTQLELTADVEPGDNNNRYRSYFELLTARPYQIVRDGVLRDCNTVLDPVLDGEGNPVLDENDQPVLQNACPDSPDPPNVTASMSRSGAHFSSGFFSRFETPGNSHFGFLTPGERRLIAEWLDIGGQYYNNHFDAPDN